MARVGHLRNGFSRIHQISSALRQSPQRTGQAIQIRGNSTATAPVEEPHKQPQPPPPPPKAPDPPPPSSRHEALQSAAPFSTFLTDTFSRQHDYLRISITERCNLRCLYCMPAEGVPLSPKKHLLTPQEILYLSSLFVSQGVTKIRLTGGEPTIHPQILPLIRDLGHLRAHGLREIALTTNGLTLSRKLDAMVASGLTGINLSLDTLDPFQFELMTRRRGFDQVMASISRILTMKAAGVPLTLKINAVVIRGLNDAQMVPFVELTRTKDVEVRFIEYMPFDGNRWSDAKMLGYREMLAAIRARYPALEKVRDRANDTSKTYRVPGFVGKVGFITSMTENFCGSCNRLRITSDGNLKVCLFGNAEVSLRDMLRKGFNKGEPIDEQAWEAMKRVEMERQEGRGAEGDPLGLRPQEMELLEVIGTAVKRKKERHAGLGQLEHMKNRPMILIDRPQYNAFAHEAYPLSTYPEQPWRRLPAFTLPSPNGTTFARRLYSSKSASPKKTPGSRKPTSEGTSTAAHSSKATAPPQPSPLEQLTHLTPTGSARMVHLPPSKSSTSRTATAIATLHFSHPSTLPSIRAATLKKGDVLSVSRIAGITAAKMTSMLIPLCHNIALSGVWVNVEICDPMGGDGGGVGKTDEGSLNIRATVRANGQTGVEMEALIAASVAALSAYDMCKAVDRGMWVGGVRVVEKRGGRSGDWVNGVRVDGPEAGEDAKAGT